MYELGKAYTKTVLAPWISAPKLRGMATQQKEQELDPERGERIKALREQLNESQAEFGDRFDVEQPTVSRWEKGSIPARPLWEPISRVAGKNHLEFILGETLEVPLLSWVAASELCDVGDIPHESEAPGVPAAGLPRGGKWFALRVEGDSMNLVAPEGSIVFVDYSDTTTLDDRYYIVRAPEGTSFKQFKADPPRFEPYSTNRSHRIIFPKKGLAVIGRVRRVVTELP